ncbi:MAG TPA: Bcr/CflA family efflux MFS transporter [Thermohalobaculum sp.]|nr:Bcr/CflA family efflux MFS transporter [Thermohalobaculum sp.]
MPRQLTRQLTRHVTLVALLAAVTAIGPFALQALSPALPALAGEFRVPAASAQLMLSLSLVATAFATLVWGPVSDRLGRRPMMLAGMVLAALGSLLAAVAPALWLAILARLLQAAGAAAGAVLARAVAQDLYGRERAAGVIGQISAVMVLAPMLAPVLSGLIVELAGWRGVFALSGLIAAVLVGWCWAALPETAPRAPAEVPLATLRGFAEVARVRAFWSHACFGASALATFLFFVGAAPYVMQEAFGLGPAAYGVAFIPLAAAYMLSSTVCGRVTARLGPRRTILLGSALTIGAMSAGLVAMALGFDNPLGLMVPAMFHSVGAGLAVPNAVAGAVGAAPARAGAASGLFGFLQFMAGAVAAQIAGFVPHGVAAPTVAGMTVFSVLGLAGFLALEGKARSAPLPHA